MIVPQHADLAPGTLKSVLRQADWSIETPAQPHVAEGPTQDASDRRSRYPQAPGIWGE
ncbi:hypothetical protein [Streptomyces sp. NPDC001678]|uniref:hypothetical protein n=1 Tax=Streptomyces sp. NPDC001678 TaxID=3364599 RepID=UPI0036BBC87E